RPFIDDALDLSEFAHGDRPTTWGALRAGMGHPEPFNMKFLGIGNEQWTEIYPRNLEAFMKEIRTKHPDIKIIGSSGPKSDGKDFEYLWPEMKRLGVDLVDEHFYRPGEWFLKQGTRYDNYDRNGPKVFAGEYACHMKGKKENHFRAAILEAALLTGMERNADVVHMTSYAPLFAHAEGWQWRPDLIWFDNLRAMPSSSYHVQKLYGNHKGTHVVPLTMNDRPISGAEDQNGLFASAVIDEDSNTIIVKVVNTGNEEQAIDIKFAGLTNARGIHHGKVVTLTYDDPEAENTLENPDLIKPATAAIEVNGDCYNTRIGGNSFHIYVFNL
ncbi:MAG: alpha-L-arabinofuranosidase, partial [Duncaniella sp.]|nr:alpha-L-arabinofuranosidase [Duncaniella sp.]